MLKRSLYTRPSPQSMYSEVSAAFSDRAGTERRQSQYYCLRKVHDSPVLCRELNLLRNMAALIASLVDEAWKVGKEVYRTAKSFRSLSSNPNMTQPAYIYEPLTDSASYIRLISLYPAISQTSSRFLWSAPLQSSSSLRCEIYSVPLASTNRYNALSYTWGNDNANSHYILVCTVDGEKQFPITRSLDEALRHLRHPTETITLWVDQICINQININEKNAQVPLMSRIYGQAEQVLIWLGPAVGNGHGSDALMDTFAYVGGEAEVWGLHSYFTKERYPEFEKISRCENPNERKTRKWYALCSECCRLFDLTALKAFYERPWFSRVWTVQEFCLGRNAIFVWGKERVKVDSVFLALRVLELGEQRTLKFRSFDEKVQRAKDWLNAQSNDRTVPLFSARNKRLNYDGESLYTILQRVYGKSQKVAQDPRDLIYGLHALAKDSKRLGIQPDYAPSNTVEKVYSYAARAIIQSGDLDLLRLAGICQTSYSDTFPSWAPDWRAKLQLSFSGETLMSAVDQSLFAASENSQLSLISLEDKRLLGLEGFLVDTIEEAGKPWVEVPENFKFERWQDYLTEVKRLCAASEAKKQPIYTSAQRRSEAPWRVPIGNIERTADSGDQSATSTAFEGHRAILAQCQTRQRAKQQPTWLDNSEGEAQWEQLLKRGPSEPSALYRTRALEMVDKRPYLSHQGYVGMGPLITQSEDVIAIFLGARLPYILRPQGGDRYLLLGEAYCDGIMNGEIMSQRSKQIFILV